MGTITLPNFRVSGTDRARVRLKDGGVYMEWSTMTDIKAWLYSVDQKAISGRFDVQVDPQDGTRLVCVYSAQKPQYLGVNKIILQCKYEGAEKAYDKPLWNFVRWTGDQDGEEVTIDDPEVDVEIVVEDVSSSILDAAILAALDAADEALTAKAAVEATEADVDAAEAARAAAESARVTAEAGRVAQADADHAQAAQDHTLAGQDRTEVAEAINAAEAAVAAAVTAAVAAVNEAVSDAGDATDAANAAAGLANEKADLVQQRLDTADADHTRAESDHTQAGADHTLAGTDHETAAADHTQAGTDHSTAAADHTAAAADHTRAGEDHTQAVADHVTAGEDHEQAQDDHEVMAGYDTRLGNVEGEVSQLEAEIVVDDGVQVSLEATRNLRPNSNNTVISGNNDYSYIVEVKSGKSYHIKATVPTTSENYLRGGFTQVYPANGVSVSGYWEVGRGEAILNKVAPFDGYLLLACAAEDLTSIEVFEDNAGTIGRDVYDSKIAQDVLEDTAVLAKEPINLFNKSVGVVLNKYIVNRRYEAAAGYAITGPIYVRGGVQYKCPHDSAWLSSSNVYAICKPSGEFYEGKQGTISGDFLLFTPERDCYVCLNIGRTAWVDSFMVCKASEYPDSYVSYKKTIGDDYNLGERQIEQIEGMLTPYDEIKSYFIREKSVNLFDTTNALVKHGYYYGNVWTDDAGYEVTHPIPVKGGVSYKANFYPADMGTNATIAIVDAENNKISVVNGTISGNYITITPSDDCYLCFNIGMNVNAGSFMVCKTGDFPEEYVPYYDYTELDGVIVKAASRLFGKSVIFTGDSICAGVSDDAGKGAYAKRIGDKNSMVWQNKAVSGGVIMDSSIIGGAFTISDTDFGTGADYIILEGGTNDADRIGSILNGGTPTYYGSWDETDYLTTFGKSTFCDAVQRLIQRVVTSFPSAKVGFIIAMKMGVTSNGYTKDTNNRRAYFETIIQICKKWGVPVLNLWDECTMNPRLASHYTDGQDYLYADGQHPTANGYEVITPIIEAWMETL